MWLPHVTTVKKRLQGAHVNNLRLHGTVKSRLKIQLPTVDEYTILIDTHTVVAMFRAVAGNWSLPVDPRPSS